MSRIAGLVGRADLDAMLKLCGAGWSGRISPTGHTVRDGHVALGWYGEGEPPLHEDAETLCVLDGAIYNRAELGWTQGTRNDAELFADLARRHGVTAAARLCNGDFAIALWHAPERALWLVRDRAGVRPLYHATGAWGFAFASRPRPLLALEGIDCTPSRQFVALFAASHYRYFDNDPTGSAFAAIAQVPAAHALRIRRDEHRLERYWQLRDEADLAEAPGELVERYRELMLDAVDLRLGSARAPAFTLSGGMDSSSVLACAVRVSGSRQHAFSAVYTDSQYDESDEIRSMLEAAVEQWHEVRVDAPDVMGLVGQMVDAHDEPVATATWLAHYVLCGHVADSGFHTLFGGLGGDELNAGEYEYFFPFFADLRAGGQEERLRAEVDAWQRHHDHPIFRKDWSAMEVGLARITDPSKPGAIVADRMRLERYRSALNPAFFDLAAFEPILDHPFSSYLKNRTYQDMFRETAPCCLRAEDRQTAAFGLRNCDPFFDYRLIELMIRVPGELKIAGGVTKQLLRQATIGLLPEDTRRRVKKTGWNAPADAWFSGSGRDYLLDIVGSASFRDRGIYDLGGVRRLVDEHDEIVRSGRPTENHMMFLWQLVNLELWLRWLDALRAGGGHSVSVAP